MNLKRDELTQLLEAVGQDCLEHIDQTIRDLLESWLASEDEAALQAVTIGWDLRVRFDESIEERIAFLQKLQLALQKASICMTIVVDQGKCLELHQLFFKHLSVEHAGHGIGN